MSAATVFTVCIVLASTVQEPAREQRQEQAPSAAELTELRNALATGDRAAVRAQLPALIERCGSGAETLAAVAELARLAHDPTALRVALERRARALEAAGSTAWVDAWVDLAEAHDERQDPTAAVQVVRDVLLRGNALDANARATLRANLGRYLLGAGDTSAAIVELEHAAEAFAVAGQREITAYCRINLAVAWVEIGDLVRARNCHRENVAVLRDGSDRAVFATALLNLADAEVRLGEADAAVAHAAEAVEVAADCGEIALLRARVGLAMALYRSGVAAGDDAGCRRAEELLRAANATIERERLLPADDPERLRIEHNLAVSLWQRGSVDEALAISTRVVARLPDASASLADDVDLRLGHASLLASAGRIDAARQYMADAVAVARARLARLRDLGPERALAQRYRGLRNLLSSQLSCRDFDVEEPRWDAEDAEGWLLGRGLAIDRYRRARTRSQLARDDAAFAIELEETKARAGEVAHGAAPTEAARSDVGRRQTAIAERIDASVGGAVPASASLAAMQARLPAGSALVVTATYLRFPRAREGTRTPPGVEHVCAFTIDGGTVRRFELGRADEWTEAVRATRDAVQGAAVPARGDRADPAGERPGQGRLPWIGTRLGPVLDGLDQGITRLVICPDGALAALPWALVPLPRGKAAHDRFAVTYVDHPDALVAPPPSKAEPSFLLVGDVDYGAAVPASDARWPALPGTAREIDACAAAFAHARPDAPSLVLRGGAATRARLLSSLSGRRFVHIAAHAFVEPESRWPRAAGPFAAPAADGVDPLALTGLVLAGANAAPSASTLTAAELTCADLSACELVVLASCASNHGPRAFGDAVTGLHSAARTAGASAVLSSLWAIPDDETVKFFTFFYAALWDDGLAPAAAFARAQQRARDAELPPRCWAAFVYYGPL